MKKYIAHIILAGLMVPAIFAQTPAPAAPTQPTNKVNARRANQQGRIAQGVKSGQLSAAETAKLENKEHKVNQEVHADRTANGGKLTAQEKNQVNRQQNKLSNQIYNDKHNTQTQPK